MQAAPNGAVTTVEAMNDGALGFEVGAYVNESADKTHLDHGKYVVIWKFVDGRWQMFRDTWATSMAPPGM